MLIITAITIGLRENIAVLQWSSNGIQRNSRFYQRNSKEKRPTKIQPHLVLLVILKLGTILGPWLSKIFTLFCQKNTTALLPMTRRYATCFNKLISVIP